MDRKQLLLKLGVTDAELHEFLKKFSEFLATLDKAQLAMMHRALPDFHKVLKAFGPEVTADELLHLFGGDAEHPPIFVSPPLGQHKT